MGNLFLVLKRILTTLVALVASVLVWGVLIEPRIIDEETFSAEIPNLPSAWEGKEVAVIGDFQTGMWFDNPSTIERIVENLIERNPAAILITGDFIYHPAGQSMIVRTDAKTRSEAEERVQEITTEIISYLRPLTRVGIPVYAVLGNHDYAQESSKKQPLHWVADYLHAELEASGIQVLNNEAVALPSPSQAGGVRQPAAADDSPLYLVGVGARYPNEDHVGQALEQVPETAPRIALFHHPDTFKKFPKGTAPLAVAGHTHGGQIRIPMTESWSWVKLVEKGEVYTDGWIKDLGAPGNRLYVNRGIGFSIVPIRIQAPPEVTIFTLSKAPMPSES